MKKILTESAPPTVALVSSTHNARVPLERLVRVELRKLTDTRSGRWLLLAIALLTIAVITIFLFTAAARDLTYAKFVTAAGAPQGLLIPVLGILTITSEWGQRTGLVTFALEPNRGRVVVAKLAAVLLLAAAAALAALGLAAVGNLLGATLRSGGGSWTFGLAGLRDIAALQVVSVVQGFALGLLIMMSAGAIVTYFALPIIWGILTTTSEWFSKVGGWIDVNTTSQPLASHQMDGQAWGRLAVSALIWIALPLVLGWLRLLRREFKSA